MKTPSLTRRQEQGEQSRQAIIASAADLFSRHGYAATPVSRLSEACGLPPSSIYWHFGSKEGLLATVIEHTVEEFVASFPRIDQFAGSPIERFKRMVAVVADTLDTGQAPSRLIIRLSLEEADTRAPNASRRAMQEALLRARDIMLELWREAVAATLQVEPGEDDAAVENLARLGRALALGSFVTERGGLGDLRSTLETFADAVAAMARQRGALRP